MALATFDAAAPIAENGFDVAALLLPLKPLSCDDMSLE